MLPAGVPAAAPYYVELAAVVVQDVVVDLLAAPCLECHLALRIGRSSVLHSSRSSHLQFRLASHCIAGPLIADVVLLVLAGASIVVGVASFED